MKKNKNSGMTYTSHGKHRALGKLVKIGNTEKIVLAYVEKDEVVGYKPLDDIVRDSYTKDLPKYDVDF